MDYQDKTKEELIDILLKQKLEFDSLRTQFNKEVDKRNQIEIILNKRRKELDCHNRVSDVLSDPDLTFLEVADKIVKIVPQGMQFPELALASLQIYDTVYRTTDFQKTKYAITQKITANKKNVGLIEVCYPEEQIPATDELFLPEESKLLFAIAVKLGHYIEKEEKRLELLTSKAEYRNLLEKINDVIYEIDADGTVRYISPTIQKVLGYSEQEITGKNFRLFVGENEQVLSEKFADLKERHSTQSEYKISAKDGQTHWIRLTTSPLFEDGQFKGGFGTMTDITEKKLIELELQKSESLYRSILQASPDAIFIADLQGLVLFISPMAAKMFGFDQQNFPLNTSLFNFVATEDHYKARDAIKQMFDGKYNGSTEYVGVRADGTTFDMDVNGEFIRDQEGNPVSIVFVARDITEKKTAEEKLRKSEETYRHLVETINDVVYEVTHEGIIKYVSPSIERLIGYSAEELIGQYFFQFMHPDDRPMIAEKLRTLTHKNYSFLEYRYFTKGGEICWVRSSTSPIFENDQMIGGRGVLIDITERKKAEEQLRESEEKFRMVFENVFDGISIFEESIDPYKRKLIECNEQYAAMAGRTRDELLQIGTVYSLTKTLDENENNSRIKSISEKHAYHGSFKWIRPDGKDNTIEYTAMPVSWRGNTYSIGIDRNITEYKQKEDELRKLSMAVEQSPVSIVITNLDGNIEYANPSACQTTGYSIEELKGKNPRVLKSGETPTNEYEYLWDTITHGSAWKGLFHNKRKNGELYWESSQIVPITDKSGQTINYLAIKEDITERKRIQEDLFKSEARFRQVAEQSKTVIWEVDDKGLYTYVSPVSWLVWGYEPDELVGKKHFYDIHPEEGRQEFKQIALKAFEQQAVFRNYVNPIETRDKKIIWVSTNGEPICDNENNLVGYRGADNDITERKLAEEALVQSETALNYAQEIANMGSWHQDMKTHELRWSKNYYRILGLDPGIEYIKNDLFTDIIHPDDRHLIDEKRKEIQQTKLPVSCDMRLVMPDGSIKWIQNNIVPHFEGNHLVALSGVNIDITEKKQSEEKIRQHNERLSAIIGAIPDLIFIADKNGNYLEYYSSQPDMLVVPDDQIIGKNINELFEPELAKLHIQKIQECLRQQKLITYEFSGHDSSVLKSFEIRLTAMADDRVLTFVRDITDKVEKEAEVKKLSLAIEQSPVSIVITDLDANIQYVNPAFELTSGYTADEIIGKSTNILKSGLTSPDVYAEMWDTIGKGIPWKGEWVNKRKNGEFYWEDISITPIHDQTEKITNYLAVKQDVTERKRTDEILKQNEEKYRYMFVNNPQPMWIYDLETLAFLEVNNAAIDHYGYSRDEFRSMTLKDIRPKDDIDLLLEDVKHAPSQYSPASEWRHLKKNGELINVEIISHPIEYNDRPARHVLVNDITKRKIAEDEIKELNAQLETKIQERTSELKKINIDLLKEIDVRKLTEQALAQSEQSYRMVVENVAEVIFQTDANGVWVFLNKSWENITGFPVKESIGQNFINFVHPDDRARNWELFEPLIKREKDHCHHEIRYLTKDGGFRWIEVYARLGLDANEQMIGTYGTLQDITERKQAEETVVIQKERLESIIEGSSIGTWEWNIQTGELLINDIWAAQIGYTLEELVPTSIETWAKLVHPDDLLLNKKLLEKHFKGESEFYLSEDRIRHKNGGWIWIASSGKVISRTEDGKPLWMFGSHHDITEKKRAELFENELLQLSPKLTGVSSAEIDSAINLALSRIGQVLEADRSYVFELSPDNRYMNNTFEWCNDGIEPQIQDLQNVPTGMLPEWMKKLNNLENIIIDSVKDLPESWSAERKILEPQEIQSLIVIPMLVENSLIGFVGLDSVRTKKIYTPTEINILKVWGSMLSSLINNQRSELLFEQTRQNYETFFNTIDDFLWVLDIDGNIIHTNNTVKNRLNYSPEELLNKPVLMVHPPERRDETARIMKEMLVGKTEFCPVPVVTKSGKMIPVETHVKSGFWNGNPVIFGVSKDISQVQLSEQKFASAFQSNSAIMAISDFSNGKYIDVNNAFLETLEFTREEVIGKTSVDLQTYVDTNDRNEIIKSLNENIPVRKKEIRLRTKKGIVKTGLISADNIFIGQNRCMLTVTIDITDRKNAEEELKKARIEAEQANAAKSEFLSRMSHELRTPMNSILGFAQLLEMGELNPGQKKGVNHIMKSGKHLLDLINEVLDISRIESGRLSLSLEPVQLSSLIPEMTDVVKLQAAHRQIKVELLNSPDNQLYVNSDRQRLKQVLLNLLNNAIKYNRLGGSVLIKIEAQQGKDNAPQMIRISITDTGVGIPEENIPKLFIPFERIGADKTSTEGTGLGLSVVKKLMEAMGGYVGVSSIPEEGSTFWIELPQIESQIEKAIKSGDLTGNGSQITGKTGFILYIEDNRSNIDLVEQIISSQRADIELFTDMYGEKAVELAVNHRPDLILLDLNLPDIPGNVVLKRLKANEQTKDIPVVVVSADAMPQQLNKLLNAGAKHYLTKPLDIPEFLRMIEEFLPDQNH